MFNIIKRYFPIDLFSKKRILFNLIVYGIHTLIFCICFAASYYLASIFRSISYPSVSFFLNILPLVIALKLLVFSFFNFKRISHYILSNYDIFKTFAIVFLSSLLLVLLSSFMQVLSEVPLIVYNIDCFLTFTAVMCYHFLFVFLSNKRNFVFNGYDRTRTLIIGAGETSEIFSRSLQKRHESKIKIVGYVDDDSKKIGMRINGIKIYGPIANLHEIAKKTKTKKCIIAIPSAKPWKIKEIIDSIKNTDIDISTLPSYFDIINGNVTITNTREIGIEDLLRRDKIEIDWSVAHNVNDKCILITGAAGSIGSEICRQILKYNPKTVIALDQAETALFYLEKELNDLNNKTEIIPIIADITNYTRMNSIFKQYQPDIVYHAAAYKHVPMMEKNIEESIRNNVLGTKNVAECSELYRTSLFVMISTDKAVNPTSVMGLTKRIAELYVKSINDLSETNFITVRFGNVLDSSGNVIKIFKEQIKKGGPVTITHPEMKRYFMLTSEAVQLVIQAGFIGKGGEIFLLDMGEPVKIIDLAKTMIKIAGLEEGKDIKIIYTGIRPGEKLFEELNHDNEELCLTLHPKIFMWKSNGYNWEFVNSKIKNFINITTNNNYENVEYINNLIREIVPEYKSNNITMKSV